MKSELTREESRALRKIGINRVFLWFVLAIVVIAAIVIVLFIVGEIGSGSGQSNIPEWFIIPIALAFILLGAVIGLINYLTGRLEDKEKVYFVRTSIDSLKSSKSLSARTEAKIFRSIAQDLVRKHKNVVIENLVSDGWPGLRAKFYTELVVSLIIKCEWNISYKDQIADFSQMLVNQRWSNRDIQILVAPIIEILKDPGGRLTTSGITRSIYRNIAWIVFILGLALILGWVLITHKALELDKKYDFLKFIVLAIPTVLGFGYNIFSIIRKLSRKPPQNR